ncbi:UNVERIFIED_CONTAM: hypothetical protein K2H54_038518 [Gekko kuhli]
MARLGSAASAVVENRNIFRQVLKLQQEPLRLPLTIPLSKQKAEPEGKCLSHEENMLQDCLAEKGHELGTKAEEGHQV